MTSFSLQNLEFKTPAAKKYLIYDARTFCLENLFNTLHFQVDRYTHDFLPPSKPRVCFKPITWYIEMHQVRAFFLCLVMTFLYYLMVIHNMFVLKRKAYRSFCLPQNCQHGRCLSAEYKMRSAQIQFRVVFFRRKTPGMLYT